MRYRRTVAAIISALISSGAYSAEQLNNSPELSPTSKQGETIVIIGKIPRPIEDVFGTASVITADTINQELAHDIADLVRYQAGISIENAGTRFGFSGFSIRGIGGNRVATEVDGVPVADQFGIGSYSNSGRNLVDIDLVQQVEILRGPASSVYGSNAIGGVVSFVTKKPADLLAKSNNDVYLGLKAGYYGVDSSYLTTANTAFAVENSSFLLSASVRQGHEFDNNPSTETITDQQDYDTQSFLIKYFYDINDNQQISFSYDDFTRQSETDVLSLIGVGRFRSTTGLFGDDETTRTNISLAYDFVNDDSWIDGGVARAYHQTTETKQLTDETRFSRGTNFHYDRDFFYEQSIDGIRVNLYSDVDFGGLAHKIGYGVEWNKREVTELRNGLQTNLDAGTSTNVILSEDFPLRDFPISTVTETGVYLNDEIELADGFLLIPALRYDQYKLDPNADAIYLADNPETEVVSIDESNVSPKLGFQHQISPESNWFFQYFEGFRAPPFEDANIGLDIALFGIRAIPNPDLKSEKSSGYELGFHFENNHHRFDLVGFSTDYDDFIQTKVNLGFDPVSSRVIFQSQNIDEAKIYGGELQYAYTTTDFFSSQDSLTAYANFFWSKGENEQADQPLNDLDPNHLLLGTNWTSANDKLTIAFHASLYAAKDDITDLEDPDQSLFQPRGYAVFDLIANYKINETLTVSAAVYNLTDHKYWRWSDVNGLVEGDPVIETLAASGTNGSIQLQYSW